MTRTADTALPFTAAPGLFVTDVLVTKKLIANKATPRATVKIRVHGEVMYPSCIPENVNACPVAPTMSRRTPGTASHLS
jgi:hypothetical protein